MSTSLSSVDLARSYNTKVNIDQMQASLKMGADFCATSGGRVKWSYCSCFYLLVYNIEIGSKSIHYLKPPYSYSYFQYINAVLYHHLHVA